MIDICAEQGWLASTLRIQNLMQMVIQGAWIHSSPLLNLPHIEDYHVKLFRRHNPYLTTLPGLMKECVKDYKSLAGILRQDLSENQIEEVKKQFLNLKYIISRR